MDFALVKDGNFVRQLTAVGTFEDGDIITPWDSIRSMDDESRREMGIYPVAESAINFDPVTESISAPVYFVGDNHVHVTYNIGDLPLETAQANAYQVISNWRNMRELGPFKHNEIWYDGGAESIRRLTGATLAATIAKATGAIFLESWTRIDGQQTPFDNPDAFIAFAMAKNLATSALFASSKVAKTQVSEANSVTVVRESIEAFKTANPVINFLMPGDSNIQEITPGYVTVQL